MCTLKQKQSADSKRENEQVPLLSPESDEENSVTEMLDKMSDLTGLKSLNSKTDDWTDLKHSERKKRDRILPDGELLKLMKKSDYEGFKRVLSNLSLLLLTAFAIHKLQVYPIDDSQMTAGKLLIFLPLYLFYGFQMQCFAFAGGHELLHGNAFKTRWINTVVTFCVGTAFFEVLWHERMMHKQHHTFTLDKEEDPELTSFYTTEELADPRFMSVPDSRYSYLMQFINVISYFRQRVMRLVSSSLGIATDYTGTGWSMKTDRNNIDSNVLRDMQLWSILQLTVYVVIFSTLATTWQGIQSLLFWWMVPCIVGYGPINFFRNAEHADCDFTNNQLLNTRTVESNRFIRWLLWETNFHAEHHIYPMVPFFNLPVVHEMIKAHVKHSECKGFASQNWNLIKAGGWIDQQSGSSD